MKANRPRAARTALSVLTTESVQTESETVRLRPRDRFVEISGLPGSLSLNESAGRPQCQAATKTAKVTAAAAGGRSSVA